MNLIPKHGERALIVGRSGSGKTLFARWLLWHLPQTVIYDFKHEPAFDAMGPIVDSTADAWRMFAEEPHTEYVIVRPDHRLLADPFALDELLLDHYDRGAGYTAYLDEAYTVHRSGRAGPGYLALLTRGRSREITTISATQRPAFLSLYALTEANHIFAFRLQHQDDRARLGNIIEGYQRRPKVPWHSFDYANAVKESIVRFGPIDVDFKRAPAHSPPVAADLAPRSEYFTHWI